MPLELPYRPQITRGGPARLCRLLKGAGVPQPAQLSLPSSQGSGRGGRRGRVGRDAEPRFLCTTVADCDSGSGITSSSPTSSSSSSSRATSHPSPLDCLPPSPSPCPSGSPSGSQGEGSSKLLRHLWRGHSLFDRLSAGASVGFERLSYPGSSGVVAAAAAVVSAHVCHAYAATDCTSTNSTNTTAAAIAAAKATAQACRDAVKPAKVLLLELLALGPERSGPSGLGALDVPELFADGQRDFSDACSPAVG